MSRALNFGSGMPCTCLFRSNTRMEPMVVGIYKWFSIIPNSQNFDCGCIHNRSLLTQIIDVPAHCFQHITSNKDRIYHAQNSNYIAATHNITPSQCTSKCTTHTPLPTPLPSTTLLCTQLTNTKHICVSGGKMAQDVGMA